jgi:hypothetical protein
MQIALIQLMPRLGWYAIQVLGFRLAGALNSNMPGSAADTGYP